MKAKNVLDKLKDLKLRRWGQAEYTEAKNSNRGGSGEIDYEDIYQFYKKKVIETISEEYLEEAIIPEHFIDIVDGTGESAEYENKYGIWKGELGKSDMPLFVYLSNVPDTPQIYFGEYIMRTIGPS